MKFFHLLLCLGSALTVGARADALTLYASTAAGSPGELYILDATTGAMVQDVGPLKDSNDVNYPVTGLAFHPHTGALWGSTGNNPAATAQTLVKINPATAEVIAIGQFNIGGGTMTDLTFDAAGNLYGIGSVGGAHLYSINTSTGQATIVGNSGFAFTTGGGIAVSPGGIFYGSPNANSFGTYDSTTGAYSNIANPDKPAGTGAYTSFDFNGSVLFGLNTGPGSPPPTHLVTIDPTTGAVTDLGASINSLDAIAFQPAPAGLTGDYNNNGKVDAADYALWRKNNGTSNSLGPNDPIGVPITLAQYTQWRSNFGNPGSGAGSAFGAVPEPSAIMLAALGLILGVIGQRSRCR